MKKQAVGGHSPILTLLHLTRLKGWKAQLLKYRSGARSTGEVQPKPDCDRLAASAGVLGAPERKFMMDLARRSIASAVANTTLSDIRNVAPGLEDKKACFVTLTSTGALRGCIGHLRARLPLYQAVIETARNAALHDPRFPPVQTHELDGLRIEISVLTEPKPLSYSSPEDLLRKLHPGEHGVLLQMGPRLATFLPRVWEQIPDKIEFLGRLSEKAGCSSTAWRDPEAVVSLYHTECFEEPFRTALTP